MIFDPQAEYDYPGGSTAPQVKAEMTRQLETGKALKVAFKPADEHITALHHFSLLAWAVGNVTVVIDEASLSLPVTQLPKGKGGAMQLILQGRHKGVSLVAVTQRPALISSSFRANINRLCAFRLMYEKDIAAVADIIGRQHRPALQSLQQFEYMDYDGETAQKKKVTLR